MKFDVKINNFDKLNFNKCNNQNYKKNKWVLYYKHPLSIFICIKTKE